MNQLEIILNLCLTPIRLPIQLYTQYEQQNILFKSNEDFINQQIGSKRVVLGGSWSATQYYQQFPDTPIADKAKLSLEGFTYVHQNWNMTSFRLGSYWDENQLSYQGEVTIPDDLDNLIQYSIQNNLSITLNVGPIKTFRYPEVYIPKFILSRAGPIPVGYVVTKDSVIGESALNYLNFLLAKLIKQYGLETLNKVITAFQLDNEPKNPFGPTQMTMGDDYIWESVRILRSYFEQPILFSGPLSPLSVPSLIDPDANKLFVTTEPIRNKRVGLNYYHYTPGAPAIPQLNLYPDNFVGILGAYGGGMLSQFRDTIFEVSECQMEQWGDQPPYNSPGNSITNLRFIIMRNMIELMKFNPHMSSFLISLWGIEILAYNVTQGKPTLDQEQMVDLIAKINNRIA